MNQMKFSVSPSGNSFNESRINRRQDAPACYDLTTIAYVSRPDFIIKSKSMWDGNVHGVEIPYERCIDLDNPFDYTIAKFLMEKRDSPEF